MYYGIQSEVRGERKAHNWRVGWRVLQKLRFVACPKSPLVILMSCAVQLVYFTGEYYNPIKTFSDCRMWVTTKLSRIIIFCLLPRKSQFLWLFHRNICHEKLIRWKPYQNIKPSIDRSSPDSVQSILTIHYPPKVILYPVTLFYFFLRLTITWKYLFVHILLSLCSLHVRQRAGLWYVFLTPASPVSGIQRC